MGSGGCWSQYPGRGVKPDVETSTGTMVTSTMDWEMGSWSGAEMVKEGGGVLFDNLSNRSRDMASCQSWCFRRLINS